jgi:hypothetical protein
MEEGIKGVLWREARLEPDVSALGSTGKTVTGTSLTRLEVEVRTIKDSPTPLQSDVARLKGRMNDFPPNITRRVES